MVNETGITPILDRVLIKPLVVENKTSSGIIVSTDETSEREQLANTTGEVIAMGEDCPKGIIEVGMRVAFAKYSGLMYKGKDSKDYRMISYDNLVAKLDNDMGLIDPHLLKGVV